MKKNSSHTAHARLFALVFAQASAFVLASTFPLHGYAISRVGNRALEDSLAEAQLEVSNVFFGVTELSGGRVRLQGGPAFQCG